MTVDERRCACGTKLNSYNQDGVCGSCVRGQQDAYVREMELRADADPLPPPSAPLTCRQPGCLEPICVKSAATNAPRWRELCFDHYQEQRIRQSRSAQGPRAQRQNTAAA